MPANEIYLINGKSDVGNSNVAFFIKKFYPSVFFPFPSG